MPRFLRHLLLAVLVIGATLSAQQRTPTPSFRSGIDLIAIDAEVFDKEGRPVEALTPDAFEVTVGGHARRVVSATFVDYAHANSTLASTLELPGATGLPSRPAGARTPARAGRLFVLVVDCSTFNALEARAVLEAARNFVKALQPDDRVGVLAFPVGPALDPTTDRTSVLAALDEITGQRDPAFGKLRASELVILANFLARHPDDALPGCSSIDNIPRCEGDTALEASALIAVAEGQLASTADHLQRLMQGMEPIPGRKHVVLVSAGQITNDRGGPRLDLGDLAKQAGQWAARANATIDSLFIDRSMLSLNLAERRASALTSTNLIRDRIVLEQVLDQYADASGGTVFPIVAGAGEYAFSRIARQTSAFYLLGIEATESDRDGEPHELHVRVNAPGATIRARQWFAFPRAAPAAPARDSFAGWQVPAGSDPPMFDALVFRSPAPGDGAALALVVDGAAPPGAAAEQVEVVAAASEAGSARVADQQRALVNFTWTIDARREYQILSRLTLPRGRYDVRVGVRTDAQPGGIGSTTVEVPDFVGEPLSLSGLALFTARRNAVGQPEAITGLLPSTPTARRSFEATDRASVFLRVYQGQAVTPVPVTLTTRITDAAGQAVSDAEAVLEARTFDTDRSAEYETELPIVDLAPGRYTLTIAAHASGRSATRTLAFVVR
jgi:VWFA-related protein